MSVLFVDLPDLPTDNVSSNDYIAILNNHDEYTGKFVEKVKVNHANDTGEFGTGSEDYYGHVKLSDVYDSYVGYSESAVSGSQKAVSDAYSSVLAQCLPTWAGTNQEWGALPDEEKAKYRIVNIKPSGIMPIIDHYITTCEIVTTSTTAPYPLIVTTKRGIYPGGISFVDFDTAQTPIYIENLIVIQSYYKSTSQGLKPAYRYSIYSDKCIGHPKSYTFEWLAETYMTVTEAFF